MNDDNFKERVKKMLESEDKESDYILGYPPCNAGFDDTWILLLTLLLFLDKPVEEKKESPIVINLYFGADK